MTYDFDAFDVRRFPHHRLLNTRESDGNADLSQKSAVSPGHTWALQESPTLVRVGIDDFGVFVPGNRDESFGWRRTRLD